MKNLDFLKEQRFNGSRITHANSYQWEKSDVSHISLQGDFQQGEYPHWDLYFGEIRFPRGKDQLASYLRELDLFRGGILKNVEVTPLEKGYEVLLELAAEGRGLAMRFFCKDFSASCLRYRGMNYTNVYQEEYAPLDIKYAYLFDE